MEFVRCPSLEELFARTGCRKVNGLHNVTGVGDTAALTIIVHREEAIARQGSQFAIPLEDQTLVRYAITCLEL